MENTKVGREKLESVLREIEATDERAFVPDGPVEKNEKVLCVLPAFLRKMYALRMFYQREAAMLKTALQYSSENDRNEAFTTWEKVDDMADFLNELFWISCKDYADFYKNTPGGIGVRKDWVLVRYEKDGPTNLSDLLRSILGK